MRRGDVHDAAPVALDHLRQHRGGCVEDRGQVDRENRIPALDREFVHAVRVLDAGVVDEHVDAVHLPGRRRDHAAHLVGFRHVGRVVRDAHAVIGGESRAHALDLAGLAEAVQHDVHVFRGERGGDAQPDAARRAGDDRDAPRLRHASSPRRAR